MADHTDEEGQATLAACLYIHVCSAVPSQVSVRQALWLWQPFSHSLVAVLRTDSRLTLAVSNADRPPELASLASQVDALRDGELRPADAAPLTPVADIHCSPPNGTGLSLAPPLKKGFFGPKLAIQPQQQVLVLGKGKSASL